MSKKHDNTEESESFEPEKVEKVEKKEKGIKVKKGLGFLNGKRSFYEGGRNILLIEGETVSKEDFEAFTKEAQELLFEK